MRDSQRISKILAAIDRWSKDKQIPVVSQIAGREFSPFKVLISTVLSLRTKDKVTAEASERLFKDTDTPEKIIKLGENRIAGLIYPVGFYKTKARYIIGICETLLNSCHGRVPDEIDELLKLKGVGRKTANLVLILGYNKPAMCVDTHVHRISNRIGYISTKTPLDSEMALRKKLPQKFWLKYNDLLVTFGQYHCKPVSPFCSSCPICKYCPRNGVNKSR